MPESQVQHWDPRCLRKRRTREEPYPGLRLTMLETPYLVVGRTAGEWRDAMARLGPQRAGRRCMAYTEWRLTWAYATRAHEHGHAAAEVHVELEVETTLPVWRPPANITFERITEWNTLRRTLACHEEGHGRNGIEAAHALFRSLSALPPQPSAQCVSELASLSAARVVLHYRERDAAHDSRAGA